MQTTLNKIKKLEQLIVSSNTTDNVIDITIDKILKREKTKLKNQIHNLNTQLKEFEKKYNLGSEKFEIDYKNGKLGDNIDFIEWSATIDMMNNAVKQLDILESK